MCVSGISQSYQIRWPPASRANRTSSIFVGSITNELRRCRMVSALLCSIDSFLASLGIGLLGCSETTRRTFIVAFTVCDFSATLAAASLNSGVRQMHHGGLSLMLALVVLALVAAGVVAYSRELPAIFFWLPVLLSFDN